MTFTIKVRTSPGSLITADYDCPVHGRFEVRAPRDDQGDPPATQPCPARSRRFSSLPCGLASYWRPGAPAVHTQFVVTASRGPAEAKPHPEAMDTRPLAEGRKNEFRRARKKLREERRHKRVKELLR
jgi:hypothetical protein